MHVVTHEKRGGHTYKQQVMLSVSASKAAATVDQREEVQTRIRVRIQAGVERTRNGPNEDRLWGTREHKSTATQLYLFGNCLVRARHVGGGIVCGRRVIKPPRHDTTLFVTL